MLKFRPAATLLITILLLAGIGFFFWVDKPSSTLQDYLAETPPPLPDDVFLGEQILPPLPVPDISLIDHTGERAALTDYKGKVVLLTFAYTSCPDVCPIMFGRFLDIQKQLGEAISTEVELVFISVDPEVDTPERLAAHVKAMGGSWHFLTEDLAVMEEVWGAFNLYVEKEDPIVNHTNLAFLIDRKGLLQVQYLGLPPASVLLADIQKILNGN